MKLIKVKDLYIIRLEKGEKIVETLIKLAKKEKINAGYLSGIGAISYVELAHYNLDSKKYSSKIIEEPLEIVSLIGNIATMKKDIIIHSHIAVGNDKMEVFGGHLKEAVVAATCEITLKKFSRKVERKYSEEIGLNLLKL
jgi:uncharacterized protein